MVVDKNNGYLYYVDFSSGKLKEISYTTADNPILNCWDNPRTVGPVFKNASVDTTIGIVDTTTFKTNNIQITVFPNPSSERFTFYVSGVALEAKLQLSINDIAGKTHFSSNAWVIDDKGYIFNWDALTQPQGYYIYHIIVDGKHHLSGKIIKL